MVRMVYLLTAVHVIVSLFLIIVVLLQSGQAADLAGAFGGMGSQTVFGPRGSTTVLSKATTWAAIIFMLTSLALAIIGGRHMATTSGSVLDNRVKSTPAAPQNRTASPPPVSVTPTAPASGKPIQQPNVNYSVQEPGKQPAPVGQKAQPAQPKK
jgi:preprotein translocase subunit SecG